MKRRAKNGLAHDLDTRTARTVSRRATRGSTWPQHESPPPKAPHIGAIEGKNPHRRSPHPPPRRKRGEASSLKQSETRSAIALMLCLIFGLGHNLSDRQHQIRLTTTRVTDTHTEHLLNDRMLKPVPPHVLLRFLVVMSPRS